MSKQITPIETLEEMAKNYGVDKTELVKTTIERYKTEMSILEKLKKIIDSTDAMTSKEYVKGRENIVVHPAITEYSKHTSVANNTAITLTKIFAAVGKTTSKEVNALEDIVGDSE